MKKKIKLNKYNIYLHQYNILKIIILYILILNSAHVNNTTFTCYHYDTILSFFMVPIPLLTFFSQLWFNR